MDHETTLANSGSAKKGQTFDNAQGDAFVVKLTSLASGTDDLLLLTLRLQLHMKNLMIQTM